jgi:hypothetical protein
VASDRRRFDHQSSPAHERPRSAVPADGHWETFSGMRSKTLPAVSTDPRIFAAGAAAARSRHRPADDFVYILI